MYNDEFEEKALSINKLYLDPNNPRFWTEKTTRDIADRRIVQDDIQARALKNIENHGVEELMHSILRNGFLRLDRIVVREIEGHADKYVAVEGNRRLAALKILRERIEDETIDEEGITDEDLESLKSATEEIQVLVYNGQDRQRISWTLQGIRHISGIKEWAPAQRAKLVAEQIEQHNLRFREAGQKFGLSAQAIGRLYRAYKALEQMRHDDEFQSKARNNYFTLFEEAYRNIEVRNWLEWNESKSKFLNEDRRKQFYSWIVPDEENENLRRIHDPRQIKKLGFLIADSNNDLLTRIDSHDLPIDSAYENALTRQAEAEAEDWRQAFEKATQFLSSVSVTTFYTDPEELEEFLEEINKIAGTIEIIKKQVSVIMDEIK